jgi:hypothetical protein
MVQAEVTPIDRRCVAFRSSATQWLGFYYSSVVLTQMPGSLLCG